MSENQQQSRFGAMMRAGLGTDPTWGAVVPPLYSTSTYQFEGLGQPRKYDYARSGNPNRDMLGDALAIAEGGAGGTITATGTAAMLLAVEALVKPGGRVVAPHDCYSGTWRLLNFLASNGRIAVEYVNLTDDASAAAALATPADLAWIETPSNPLVRITDVRRVAELAHQAGAVALTDNTFCSPVLQQPLDLGCDVVVHSTTKYINGHSDVVGGAVIAKTQAMHEHLLDIANVLGVTGSPGDAHQTLRGLRTLQARMRLHHENAEAIVELLKGHDAVERIYYPGLTEHPGHEIAKQQQSGFGSVVSFDVRGGLPAAHRLVDGLRHFFLAESLGGVESLIDHAASMTHVSMTPEARATAGIGDGLFRLSVGIDPVEDLVADLKAGLDRALG